MAGQVSASSSCCLRSCSRVTSCFVTMELVELHNYLEPVLTELVARGYTFGTVSELMGWTWDDADTNTP